MTAIIGLSSAFALIGLALALGGSAAAFINGAGLLIVVFGTLAVTAISFTAEELAQFPTRLWRLVHGKPADPGLAARQAIGLAERARKDGVHVLERALAGTDQNPFLKNAMLLIADGTDIGEAERLLAQEARAMADRHGQLASILGRAGEIAPAMGLIGTLIGLVQMLGRLDDPAAIGPAMAVALLTTFYGAVLAHLVCLPLAAKAERQAEAEALVNAVYTMAATGIGRQEHPRRLEALINAALPPEKRVYRS
ncbi:MAG: MotA/TolQ/ExbB proton channel family protein [Sphingomonadales bacterium]